MRVPKYTRIIGMCYHADGTVNNPIDAECQVYDTPIPTQCEPNFVDFQFPLLGEVKSFNFLVECCDPSLGVSRLQLRSRMELLCSRRCNHDLYQHSS